MTPETLSIESPEIPAPLYNHEALAVLKQERDRLSIEATPTETLSTSQNLRFAIAYPPLIQVEKLNRIIIVMEELLNTFRPMGVKIFPAIQQPAANPIDLFVQFPKKAHIIISLRSKGDGEAFYNAEKETLYFKRKEKGNRLWSPCPLVELGDYTMWLNRNRLLFGMSSKDIRNIPLAKVLALWKPTRLNRHRQHLYSKVGSVELLAVKRKGIAFIISKEEIVGFIKAYLASFEAKNP